MSRSWALGPVHHIAVVVADLERSLSFYTSVLGFTPVERPDLGFAGAWLSNGSVGIHLIVGQPPNRPGLVSSRGDHLAFRLPTNDQLTQFIDHLDSLSISYITRTQRSTNVPQVFFRDPDGNTWEVGLEG